MWIEMDFMAVDVSVMSGLHQFGCFLDTSQFRCKEKAKDSEWADDL